MGVPQIGVAVNEFATFLESQQGIPDLVDRGESPEVRVDLGQIQVNPLDAGILAGVVNVFKYFI